MLCEEREMKMEEKKCPWRECAHGMGVAAYGSCYAGGNPQEPLCQKFISDEEWEKKIETKQKGE